MSRKRGVLVGSVGKGGVNRIPDVRLVQWLLNAWLVVNQRKRLVVDGIAGPLTEAAILAFQKSETGVSDDRVDPNGPTIKALVQHYFAAVRGALPLYGARGSNPNVGAVPAISNANLIKEVLDHFQAVETVRVTRGPRVSPSSA